jgi:hypothetical protein
MQFAQYDVVKIVLFLTRKHAQKDVFNKREPHVGDVATIIEIYTDPLGYELECCDEQGITEWMIAFGPDEIELELVK